VTIHQRFSPGSNYPAWQSLTGGNEIRTPNPSVTSLAYTLSQFHLRQQILKMNLFEPGAISGLNATAANIWIGFLEEEAESVSPWILPNVTSGDAGEVTLEWWSESKKLTLYIANSAIQVIRVWGPDIELEMTDHELRKASEFRDHWRWLWS
jgi:hypothetical protein